ncbi:hypothetical protein XA68_13515 [Ophiocordyceps unilateralis]|uniref:FCP1 homology domain-containing protein n=1 Tax=Ophiocordyceps unilateralis TaxID=268505 RepID=A0A2A9PM65_OPHUN|nr:hypothetical protein XA68_13515 [Ophiocordyceps unilateralis]
MSAPPPPSPGLARSEQNGGHVLLRSSSQAPQLSRRLFHPPPTPRDQAAPAGRKRRRLGFARCFTLLCARSFAILCITLFFSRSSRFTKAAAYFFLLLRRCSISLDSRRQQGAMSGTVASSVIPAENQPHLGLGQLAIEAKAGDQALSDGTGGSKSDQKLLKVPSRSSSQQRNQSSAASTGLSGATVTDQRNSISGRSKDSKSSLTGRHRKGSASSRRSGRDSEQEGGKITSTASHSPVSQRTDTTPAVHNGKDSSNNGGNDGCGSGENQIPSQEYHDDEPKPPPPPPPPAVTIDPPKSECQDNGSEPQDIEKSDGGDEDVRMKDAPPVDGSAATPATVQIDETQTKILPLSPSPPSPGTVTTPAPAEDEPAPAVEEPQKWLLPPVAADHKGRKCLVLDLDETLVHSSFKILHQADFTIPVEIEGNYHNVYVIKRPGVDEFMKRVGELYEVVVFTASVSKYGDPLLDQLDIHKVVHHRLFRESCYNHQGNYVKDLSQVGRDLKNTIIIDNSPTSYIFHPQHAVPISSWFSDAHDNELLDLIPVLEDLAGPNVADVSLVLDVTL